MTNVTANNSGSRSERVWLITGATSGFGLALAEAALAAGDIVVGAAELADWDALGRDTAFGS
jgi:NAD(P)-dependent dehydrogenase (short-subunit alcohol dehydrogenase family)